MKPRLRFARVCVVSLAAAASACAGGTEPKPGRPSPDAGTSVGPGPAPVPMPDGAAPAPDRPGAPPPDGPGAPPTTMPNPPRPDGGASSPADGAAPDVMIGMPIPPPPYMPTDAGTASVPTVAVLAIEYASAMPHPMGLPDPDAPKIPARVKVYPGPLKSTAASELNGMTLVQENPVLLGGHGNSSWGFRFKSMEFDFVDAAGMKTDSPILGLPPGSDFMLIAMAADSSGLRNWFTYGLGKDLNTGWQPGFQHVEVFVNGVYEGHFGLIEAVRRDKFRVAIPKVAPDAMSGDITGGYMLKFNSADGATSQFSTTSGKLWNFHYPQHMEITAAQKTYIQQHVNKLEAAFNDSSWRSMVHLPSWIDVALIQELSGNPDGYWRSQYLYKDADAIDGGKMHLGPLWDFDIGYGATGLRMQYDPTLFVYVNQPKELARYNDKNRAWPAIFTKMWQDPTFQASARCRWEQLRAPGGPLSTAAINARIDNGAKGIAAAAGRSIAKWGAHSFGALYDPYRMVRGHDAMAAYMKDWLQKRTTFMDANLPGACQK